MLFDWLMSTDLDGVPITHPAQKQALALALADLLSRLDWATDTDITGSTGEEIAAAQEEVAKDMGWQDDGFECALVGTEKNSPPLRP